MLVITDLNGNVIGYSSGDNNTLATLYPNNPEVLTQYKEYKFPDDEDVIRNPTIYKVENGKYRLKTLEELYPPEKLLVEIRIRRDKLLAESDWTQIPDSPLTAVKKEEWAIYRQKLRDLPSIITDLNNPIWPIPPAK